jgi:hypothetical protein
MKRIVSMLLVVLSLFTLAGCSSTGGMPEALTSLAGEPAVASLTQSLGVTTDQAIGGIGSIMSLARGKLSAEQFQSLAAAIPQADKYMGALGGLGIKGSDIKDAAGLQSAFTKLGMNSDTASKFLPAVADFAGKSGGETVSSLISGLGV